MVAGTLPGPRFAIDPGRRELLTVALEGELALALFFDPDPSERWSLVLDALSRSSTFFSAALPRRIYPPLFNRYSGGQSFGYHVDNAVRYDRSRGGADPVRTLLTTPWGITAGVLGAVLTIVGRVWTRRMVHQAEAASGHRAAPAAAQGRRRP